MALEDPGWWPARGSARGEGVRVGEMGGGSGPGDGGLLFKIFIDFSLNIFSTQGSPGQRGQRDVAHGLPSRGRVEVLGLDVQLVLEPVQGARPGRGHRARGGA